MKDIKQLLQTCYTSEQMEMENSCIVTTKDLTSILEELLHLRDKIRSYEKDYKYEGSESLYLNTLLGERYSEDRI